MLWILTLGDGVSVAEAGTMVVPAGEGDGEVHDDGLVRSAWSCGLLRSFECSGDLRYGQESGQFLGLDIILVEHMGR